MCNFVVKDWSLKILGFKSSFLHAIDGGYRKSYGRLESLVLS